MAKANRTRSGNKAPLILLALALAGLGAVGYVVWKRPAGTPDNSALQTAEPSVTKPYEDTEILRFTEHDFAKLLSFDAGTSVETQVENATPYLTQDGVQSLRAALAQSRILEQGVAVETSLAGAPQIMNSGSSGGQWWWEVGAPVNVAYTENGSVRTERWKALLIVKPKNDPDNYLGFDKITLTPPANR